MSPQLSPGGSQIGTTLEEMSLSEMMRQGAGFLRRRFRFIFWAALIGAVLAFLVTTQMERRYQSKMLLMVQPPASSPIEADPMKPTMLDNFVDGQLYILESNEVLRVVLDTARLRDDPEYVRQPPSLIRRATGALRGLLRSPPPPQSEGGEFVDPAEAYALRVLKKNLLIDRANGTNVIKIRVTSDSPVKSARIANALGAAFMENRERARSNRASEISQWLDTRVIELQRQLSDAEEAVTAYRIENNLLSGTPGTTLSEQQLGELNSELIRTRTSLAEKRAALAQAQDLLRTGGDIQSLPQVQNSDIVMALREQLLDYARREAELADLPVTNPRIVALREKILVLEAQLGREVQRIVDVIANEVETLEARERLVSAALSTAGGQTGDENRSGIELRELERTAAAYQALYERYVDNAGVADESFSLLASGVEIVDRATVPEAPVSPPTKVIVLFGLLFGGGFGAVYSVLREAVQPGFQTALDVERDLGHAMLAYVPGLPGNATAYDTVLDQPFSPFAEAIHLFRYELTENLPTKSTPVLLITSAQPGEGKTNMASALAASAAAAGKDVLLVDADLRRAGLSTAFGLEGEPGLAEILQSGDWQVPDTDGDGLEGLDIIPAGKKAKSPSDLLASPAMKTFLREIRAAYDIVIIDGPPVANMADAPILSRASDAVGFVVKWNETPRDVAQKACSRLEPGRVRGVVLNDVDLTQVAQYGDTY